MARRHDIRLCNLFSPEASGLPTFLFILTFLYLGNQLLMRFRSVTVTRFYVFRCVTGLACLQLRYLGRTLDTRTPNLTYFGMIAR